MMATVKNAGYVLLAGLLPGLPSLAQENPLVHHGPTTEQRRDMDQIHKLLADNKKIRRSVTRIPGGVSAVTESDDPRVAARIYEHVVAMAARLREKRPIRQWDPLFALLFTHANKIELQIIKTKNGVQIREVSKDPYLAKAIQAHADGVSGFVKEGVMGMAREHPLPAKPGRNEPIKAQAFLGKGDGITTCPVTGAPVDRSVKAVIKGRTVFFCCASCKERTLKEPARFLKMKNN